MARPHTATNWWAALIDLKAGGRVDFLAEKLHVSDRTLRRWRTGEDVPRKFHAKLLRKLAGKMLLNRDDVPECVNASIDANK
jgi:hypothetical protein